MSMLIFKILMSAANTTTNHLPKHQPIPSGISNHHQPKPTKKLTPYQFDIIPSNSYASPANRKTIFSRLSRFSRFNFSTQEPQTSQQILLRVLRNTILKSRKTLAPPGCRVPTT